MKKNTKKIILGAVIAVTLMLGGTMIFNIIDPPGGCITIQK